MEILANQNASVGRSEKVDMFLTVHGSKFFAYQIEDIRRQLMELSDSQLNKVMAQGYKDPTAMFLISLLGGSLGIDRFMLNDVLLGIIKLVTCAGMFIWLIVDWFLIQDMAREYNYKLLIQSISFSSPQ